MRARAVHPEQLRLEPEQRPPGRHALAELDLTHAVLALATEDTELRQAPLAKPCRCARPLIFDRGHCLACGHDTTHYPTEEAA